LGVVVQRRSRRLRKNPEVGQGNKEKTKGTRSLRFWLFGSGKTSWLIICSNPKNKKLRIIKTFIFRGTNGFCLDRALVFPTGGPVLDGLPTKNGEGGPGSRGGPDFFFFSAQQGKRLWCGEGSNRGVAPSAAHSFFNPGPYPPFQGQFQGGQTNKQGKKCGRGIVKRFAGLTGAQFVSAVPQQPRGWTIGGLVGGVRRSTWAGKNGGGGWARRGIGLFL